MNYCSLQNLRDNLGTAGLDQDSGFYFLCVPSGICDVPTYYPITYNEYAQINKISYDAILYITNRVLHQIGIFRYRLQWSGCTSIYTILQKEKNGLWYYTNAESQKTVTGFRCWDDAMDSAYADLAETQALKYK